LLYLPWLNVQKTPLNAALVAAHFFASIGLNVAILSLAAKASVVVFPKEHAVDGDPWWLAIGCD
jgi:hypothetical protein